IPKAIKKDQLCQFYAGIEEVKNGYAFDDRYKFREKWFDCPSIWIFTNKLPNLAMLSADRWKIWRVVDNKLIKYSDKEDDDINEDYGINHKLTKNNYSKVKMSKKTN